MNNYCIEVMGVFIHPGEGHGLILYNYICLMGVHVLDVEESLLYVHKIVEWSEAFLSVGRVLILISSHISNAEIDTLRMEEVHGYVNFETL